MHLPRSKTARSFVLFGLAAFSLVACSDSPSEPTTPSAISVVTGATTTGRAGAQSTVTVSVTNTNGRPLATTGVSFAVASGGGTVTPVTATTDASGQASAVWTFGSSVGTQTLTITAGGITQTVTATVTAGLPASVTLSAGGGQSAAVGTAVATPPAVLIRDAANNPVSGVTVQFTSLPSGVVLPASATTDASGIARVTSWTLGPQAGTYTLQATVLDQNIKTGNPVLITATATAGAANRVQPAGALPTTAAAGTALAAASLPAVLVTDALGNPVSGATVTFAVTAGGGTLTSATATTNAQGIATASGFTLGRTAGPNTISATVAGVGSVNLSVTGTAGPAARTEIVSGDKLSAPAGQALSSGPSVRVVDQFGNPVSGATVQFVAGANGGNVLGGTQITNAQGIATVGGFTLGTTPGTYTLIARVAGAPDVTFTATALAGPATQLLQVSGDAQNVTAFGSASQPLVVRLLDASGFPVQNATVTFGLVGGSGGALSATTVQTDAQGQASTTFLPNGVLGPANVVASSGSLTPVTFTITTVQNAAVSAAALTATNFSATAGGPVPVNPAVVVRDAKGNPVPGVTVFWDTFGASSGSVQNKVVPTDANGVSSPGVWTLSLTPGVNTLAATINAANVPAIVFTATGLDIPAGATLALVAGTTPTSAPVGSSVPVAVQLLTAAGQALPDRTVQFQVTAGGGSIGGQATARAVTDANGVARVQSWTLGSTGGTTNTIVATVANGPQIIINVTTP